MRNLRITSGLGAILLAVAATGFSAPAQASFGSSAIVDPNEALASSMRTLANDPNNLQALISAGRASLAMGDFQAAAGFFGRADEAYPKSPLPKIGMGASLAMSGDPAGALAQFDRAQALGAPPSMMALDRGLALDLLGRQAEAQAAYRLALPGPQGDEARRRLALSQAIARDIRGAGQTIEPLLKRRDAAALRVNAFILALAGDKESARKTIDAAMPGSGASFEPFFRMLPILRPAEKAAAVHLGEFPKDAAQRYAQAEPVSTSPVVSITNRSDQQTRPRRNSRERNARNRDNRQRREATRQPERRETTRVAEAPRRAVREANQPNTYLASIRPSLSGDRYAAKRRAEAAERKRREAAERERRQREQQQQRQQQRQQTGASRDELAPLPGNSNDASETSVSRFAQNGARPAFTERVAANTPPPAPRPKLEIETPPPPQPKVETAAAKPKPKPAAPDIGTRGTYWVQLAGGKNKDWLDNEFRKIRSKDPSLFRGQSPHVTEGKEYFRLLVGPFDSPREAHALVNRLKGAGIDSFTWTRKPARLKIEKISG